MNLAAGMEDPLALGQIWFSSAQKLKLSAGSLLNKWGEGAHFFLSSFSFHYFCLFLFYFERRDHRNAKRSRNTACLTTPLAEEWPLYMGTVVTWRCCWISLQIHAKNSWFCCRWLKLLNSGFLFYWEENNKIENRKYCLFLSLKIQKSKSDYCNFFTS